MVNLSSIPTPQYQLVSRTILYEEVIMIYNLPTILIVDDDEAICELVSEGLTEDGYTCDIASTADEALTKLQNHHFEIALLDIKLPGKSGMELLRTFQTLSQNTEIVMMTAVKD